MGQTNNDMRIGTRSRSGAHEGAGWDSSPGPLERKRGMLLKIVSIFTAVCVCFAIQCSIKNTDNMSWLIAGHFFYLPRYDTATEEGTSDRPADRASEDCSQEECLRGGIASVRGVGGWRGIESLPLLPPCQPPSPDPHDRGFHGLEVGFSGGSVGGKSTVLEQGRTFELVISLWCITKSLLNFYFTR